MVLPRLRSTCALLMTVCVLTLGAAGKAAADTIALEWDQTVETGVGYKVHVGTASGSYSEHFDVGSATQFAFNTAVPGQRYCFAVSAYEMSSQLDGPNSAEVCGYSDAPPTLQNPGSRTSTVGQPATLQLVGSDPQSQVLTYSATGLPPGLSVMGSTGFISGTGTTAGTYNVTASANDGTLTATQQFTWVMNAATGGADTTLPVATITVPTANSSYTSTAATMSLGGTATDNVGVTQVRWSNDRGGNGTATGTATWNVAGITLQNGTNVITVTAFDAAGNSGVDTVAVAYAAPDTTRPVASITSPTSSSSYTTTGTTMNLGGTATDNVGVTQVRWSNDRGGSGVATGAANWSVSGIPLQNGTNIITVNAFDAAGNSGVDTVTVAYAAPTAPTDTTRPTISIVTPTTGTLYSTSTSSLNLTGTAADDVGVAQVKWSNDRGGTGTASGTTSWSAANIPLQGGTNVITVTALDAAGNPATDTLTVTYTVTTPAPSTVVLTAQLRGSRWKTVNLAWTSAPWRSVDIYRNGVRIKNTRNDGYATDSISRSGTYSYKVCAGGSTTACSNTATVFF
jgi:hypothetical protein